VRSSPRRPSWRARWCRIGGEPIVGYIILWDTVGSTAHTTGHARRYRGGGGPPTTSLLASQVRARLRRLDSVLGGSSRLSSHSSRVFTLHTHHHTHSRRATFERCSVFVGGVRLGVWGVVLAVCVCRCRGWCSLSVCVCVCVCVCDLLIFLHSSHPSSHVFTLFLHRYEHAFHDWTQFSEVYDTTFDIQLSADGTRWLDDFGVTRFRMIYIMIQHICDFLVHG